MGRRYWWKGTLSEQVSLLQNFNAKINGYSTALGWDSHQVTNAITLCNAIINAINTAAQCRATMQAVTNWRDIVLYGEPKGSPAGTAPVFPVIASGDFNHISA